MAVEVVTPEEYLGDVMGNLNSRRGRIESMNPIGNAQAIKARVPLSEMFGYATDLRSMTQGRADVHHAVRPLRGSPAVDRERDRRHRAGEFVKETGGQNGQAEVRAHEAAPQRRHDRSHRPRQDDADRCDHEGARRAGRRHGASRLRRDRQGSRGAPARHHDQHRARRVRDREPPLRARRLPGPRRLHQEHDHGRRADGRRDPRRLGRRRPDAADARAHPAGPPGRGAVHRRRAQQGRHGRRPRAARARRARGARAALEVRVPGRRHPGRSRSRR